MTVHSALVDKMKKLRVDALYGKRKHFNAADRKRSYHLCLGIPVLVIGVVSGSALFALLGKAIPEFAKWLGALLALTSALLASLQTFFNYRKTVEGHCTIATRYLELAKRAELVIAAAADGVLNDGELFAKAEAMLAEYADITRDAAVFSTSKRDYLLAREGLEEGEEAYTEKELEGV